MDASYESATAGRPFKDRHIGLRESDLPKVLKQTKHRDLEDLISKTIPENIRLNRPLDLPSALTEDQALSELRSIAHQNKIWRSVIGTGYSNTIVPPVIQRNILENPGWYTQYTPYQAEIAQGRLEALLNFQTMIADLTGLDIANASLLDEATACAEAMMIAYSNRKDGANVFKVSERCHPQVIDVVKTRAKPLGIAIQLVSEGSLKLNETDFGLLLQYPSTDGEIFDASGLVTTAKRLGITTILSCDILALTVLKSPGEIGADIAVGTAQRFGVPLGFGGPHAGFIAVKDQEKRKLPGRLVGVSKDKEGRSAIRLALQTREQHIRREKATSNICTAQVLLAVMSSMYAVYHGPEGLKQIAGRVNIFAKAFGSGVESLGFKVKYSQFFDTVCVVLGANEKAAIIERARSKEINLRADLSDCIAVSFDEATNEELVTDILNCFKSCTSSIKNLALSAKKFEIKSEFLRQATLLSQPIFSRYRSESEFMRYVRGLESKDLSLTTSMIPLGSCTMKLNAAAELFPVTWPEFGNIHPFAPDDQTAGYKKLFNDLEGWLSEITGFHSVSLQPNSGSQGEYAGLLAIRDYLHAKGQANRNVCLIPQSAHGTNPASAAMAGMKIVGVSCDAEGNIDIADLTLKAKENAEQLACLMVTYPSTHGVFESAIRQICEIVHGFGGQVYMDGANMNAQVGLSRPGDFGPDVCHLNLHKTFCIPHGGGGPGMGPIGVAKHLAPFLPGHVFANQGKSKSGAVSGAQWGSASILPISWMYIRMMGPDGLKSSTMTAILSANYIASRLNDHFPVLYRGVSGTVAHECIVDVRHLKSSSGIEVEDVAKRLMDYGFHAPTVSFPVAGTLMIEPTESEDLAEIDRFCEAMISIREEIRKIEKGSWDRTNNPLKNAPHTMSVAIKENWDFPYSREVAAFPAPWTKERKFWPAVSRIDSAYGDRNLVCSCS